MFLMYADEAGDPGLVNSPTRYFVVSGIVFHELRWSEVLNRIIDFRRRMRDLHGLKLREEIHAGAMLNKPRELLRIKKHNRLAIIRCYIDEISQIQDLNVINVVVDKRGKQPDYDVFEAAWSALIQRFENTIRRNNFPGPRNPDDRGMVFPDQTDDRALTILVRKMRRYNPIPNMPGFAPGYRNLLMAQVIGDPKFRLSHNSYFVQAADAASFALYQHLSPSSYIRRQRAHLFRKLEPVLCKVACRDDPMGIVWL